MLATGNLQLLFTELNITLWHVVTSRLSLLKAYIEFALSVWIAEALGLVSWLEGLHSQSSLINKLTLSQWAIQELT